VSLYGIDRGDDCRKKIDEMLELYYEAEQTALSVSSGAESLLDKMKLYDQMIPAIMSCCKAQEMRYLGRKHPNRC